MAQIKGIGHTQGPKAFGDAGWNRFRFIAEKPVSSKSKKIKKEKLYGGFFRVRPCRISFPTNFGTAFRVLQSELSQRFRFPRYATHVDGDEIFDRE